MLVDATDKDLVLDPIAGQAMHPHSAEASGKQTNSDELSFKEITTLLSALVHFDPGTMPTTIHNYFIYCERKCSSLINDKAAVKTDKSKDNFKHFLVTKPVTHLSIWPQRDTNYQLSVSTVIQEYTPRVSKMNTFRNYQLCTKITKRRLRSTTSCSLLSMLFLDERAHA